MGSAQSNEEYVDKILDNMNKSAAEGKTTHYTRNYMTLDELLQVIPPRDYPLDLQHLGIIYKLDCNHTGSFAREELLAFVNFYVSFRALEKSVDADSKFQAFCTLQLWNDISAEGGSEAFETWVCSLLAFNDKLARKHAVTESSRDKNGIPKYISKESIRSLHRLFNDRGGLGKDERTFFDLLHAASQEQQEQQQQQQQPQQGQQGQQQQQPQPPNSVTSKHDECIPTDTVRIFIQSFVKGFKDFMGTLGFQPNIPLDV